MTKKPTLFYSIIIIEENCVEEMTTFTNRTWADAFFKKTIKQRFPHLTNNEVVDIVHEGILIDVNGNTYNLIVHKKQR